jgi:hypothetical protein
MRRLNIVELCADFPFDGTLQALGIPGHHAVGQQSQGAGTGDQLFGAPPSFGG